MSEQNQAGPQSEKHERALCSHCDFPLDEYPHGARYFGTHKAHVEWYCRQRMRGEIERLKAALAQEEQEPVAHYGIIDPDYARVFTMARCIAWSEGYALAMHGSFTRDLDMIAVPWTDTACDPEKLVARIADVADLSVNGKPGKKPHGRLAYTLMFKGFADPRWVDLSVLPHPPLREWQGLTEEEREQATGWSVEHIEAALKERNA